MRNAAGGVNHIQRHFNVPKMDGVMRFDRRWHRPSGHMHGPVIIAMVPVGMVQTTVYEIIDMVTMWHRFMSAVWSVRV
jgi:hypothetical protein